MRRVLALAALMIMLAACGASTHGGSTSCGTYQGLDTAGRQSTIIAMIKQHNGDTSAASVDLTQASADLFCATHSSSDPISGIYGG